MRRLRPASVDLAVAAVLAAWAVVSSAQVATPATAQPWCSLVAALWVLPLAWRRSAPLAMSVGVCVAELGFAVVPGAPSWDPFEAALLIGFSLGLHLSTRPAVLGLLVVMAGAYVTQAMTTPFHGVMDTYASIPLIIGGPAVTGGLLRRSRERTAEVARLGAQLAGERDARARDAAAAERNRIARDLHDVISHSVGAMVVQASAAELQLPEASPAREQLRAVRRTGKETLTELRRQLGVLREVDL